MNCPDCQREIHEDANLCPYCGRSLKSSVGPRSIQTAKKTGRKILVGVLVAVGVVAIGCISCVLGGVLISNNPSTDLPQASAEATYTPTLEPLPASSTSLPVVPQTPLSTPTPQLTATSTFTPEPTATPTPERVEARVVDVVDGDTIEVEIGGQIFTVRYIGIDTPETVRPSQPVEWMGPEASEANRQLVEGQIVYLEQDVSETDQYGRLLRYVFLVDGTFINDELMRQGYAQVSTYPPDVRYQELFLQTQQEAREAARGLWGPTPTPTSTPTPTPTLRPTATRTLVPPVIPPTPIPPMIAPPPPQNCDPSYPDVCIPPPPPDLDCGDIPYRRFRVLPPDPHGFDGDGDGIGCES